MAYYGEAPQPLLNGVSYETGNSRGQNTRSRRNNFNPNYHGGYRGRNSRGGTGGRGGGGGGNNRGSRRGQGQYYHRNDPLSHTNRTSWHEESVGNAYTAEYVEYPGELHPQHELSHPTVWRPEANNADAIGSGTVGGTHENYRPTSPNPNHRQDYNSQQYFHGNGSEQYYQGYYEQQAGPPTTAFYNSQRRGDNHRVYTSARDEPDDSRGNGSHRKKSDLARQFKNKVVERSNDKTISLSSNASASEETSKSAPLKAIKSTANSLEKESNRRDALSAALTRNAYDCMICCEKVRRVSSIWNCQMCYNVFHLSCVRKWANSSADDVGWRCPGCQTYCNTIPDAYRCFCSKTKNPISNRHDVPHSCGEMCGRTGQGGANCTHPCQLLCHPGPCPPCDVQQTRLCCCGKKSATVLCSSKAVITCGGPCDKLLNCHLHQCLQPCHFGDCAECAELIKLECHCGRETKNDSCSIDTLENRHYSCTSTCGKKLNCSRHSCSDLCHPGYCKPCKTSPEAVLSCPCGQTAIAEACYKNKIPLRKSCLDPIPSCFKRCSKILECGPQEKHHRCQDLCHLDVCKPCPLVTPAKCRCNSQQFEIACAEFRAYDDVICEKKCTKKRSCGRHKCNTKCCIDVDHICPIVCNKPLRCGIEDHKCQMLCHNGHCHQCRIVSFEELTCECGAAVIYPPVPCGTKPPPCDRPCGREHSCDHAVHHPCHAERNCPPCTILTEKWCYGKHEMRKNILCYISQFSCGMPCQKLLSCGRHKCIKICHNGQCIAPKDVCRLPCSVSRSSCGHYCASPCHDGVCPETKCKEMTEVVCQCTRRREPLVCWKRQGEYERLIEIAVAAEMKELLASGRKKEEVNVEELTAAVRAKKPKDNILNCDKECARVERNRKLALALQLENPDVSTSLGTPHYSDMLLKFTKKNPQFVEMVHEKLKSLVMTAKKSKKMNNCYAFDSMNRDKRHVVHEYSDHFGILSESFDEEPNRNVVVTASREKSYLPTVSLIDAVFRPKAEAERKNAHEDVQLVAQMRSCIIAPQNKKFVIPSSSGAFGMVQLTGLSTPESESSTPSSEI